MNNKIFKCVVPEDENPLRLDHFLQRSLSSDGGAGDTISRSQVRLLITSGFVTVNGEKATKAGTLLKPGYSVEAEMQGNQGVTIHLYDLPLDILFEDESVIVVNKPSNLSTHPGAGNKEFTLVNALAHYFQSSSSKTEKWALSDIRPGIVHRLDKDTTGVLVVAKNISSHAALSTQFKERTVGRTYSALVLSSPRRTRGIDHAESGEIAGNIGRHPTKRTLMAVVEGKGKEAVTKWEVVERMNHAALLDVTLMSGRTHQIRVHMDHVQSPVIGDSPYGNFTSLPPHLRVAAQSFGRQALHAAHLSFDHPVTGKRLSFSAALPDDFKKLCELFRAD